MLRVFLGFAASGAIGRNGHLQHCAPAGSTFKRKNSKESCDPLLNAEQPKSCIVRTLRAGWLESAAIVVDAQLHTSCPKSQKDLHLFWVGMLRGVGHRFFAYPQQVSLGEGFNGALRALNRKAQADTCAHQRSLADLRESTRKIS